MHQGMRKIKIGVSDESPFILYSIQTILLKEFSDLSIAAYPIETEDLLSKIRTEIPDILITDFCFNFERNDLNGARKIEQIYKQNPELKIIIFTAQKSQAVMKSILQIPISAIVHKRDNIRDLVRAFNWACSSNSGIYYSEQMKNLMLSAPENTTRTLLSPSEVEVIRLFAIGYSLMEIAKARKRSISTVATQKYNAMRKLQLQTNTDLIKYVFAQELV
ncbi:response regulator transcription factor [Pantoea sp. Lij88]|uniref:response regulator transcription factor n=1 Tax=Pantoea sp. Lij88 TaxID=3028622 RepID=UPI0024BB6818|nr:response regulator transcription factor [Pantoea sp. Lij88]WHQ73747.1 response regulator transcription factor [Pantoea sp. Lij88]